MIRNVLSGIGGVGIYGVVAVLLFFGVFLGVLYWAMGLRRPYLERMSRLPLEADEEGVGDPSELVRRKDHE